MPSRLSLSQILRSILGTDNVYFQPPPSVKMKYPAIVYEKDGDHTRRANNGLYSRLWRYKVTVIDPNPDTTLPDKVSELPMCRLNRVYTGDNLNHYSFTLYY